MPTTFRVHSLAKELGVPSKVIIAKCQAEGIELKNHMAAISLGLAESIREWFSVGDDVTSVEVAAPVDVKLVRKVSRQRRKKAPGRDETAVEKAAEAVEPAPAPAPGTATEVAEAPAEIGPEVAGVAEIAAPVVEKPAEPIVELPAAQIAEVTGAPEVTGPAVGEKLVARAPTEVGEAALTELVAEQTAAEATGVELETVEPPGPAAEEVEPAEPVLPAGPQVVPKPADLRGPRVVRVEAPERPQFPRPRPRPGTLAARGPTERVPAPSMPPSAPPRRGRGKRRKPEDELETTKLRTRSPRRHGAAGGVPAEVDQRLLEWRDQDLLERRERLARVTGHGLRDRRAAERRRQATARAPAVQIRKEPVAIVAPISLKDFCAAIGAPFIALSKKLMEQTGQLWAINQSIDAEQAELLALDLDVPITVQEARTAYEALAREFAEREHPNLQPRPPVVAMLGHVDHGKTSLLDVIRKTDVVAGEAGGITQHIGAYRIRHAGWDVTFVDTPGHEAFTAMRARGANLTDVVVLVVAADDGVMPQTIEAINHAKAAGVAIVVALNKIDLPGVDVNRVYTRLAEQGLIPSEWGGETDVIKTSAVTSEGIDTLLTHLSTLSDLMELKADPTVPAQALVIESQMCEGRGVVAQVLVREGTLRPAQFIVCGPGSGRIRALLDDSGKPLRQATPGTPVVVSGLDEMPEAGDRLYQVDSGSLSKQIAEEVRQRRRAAALEAAPKPRSLEALLQSGAEAEVPDLNVIVKADVQGSAEVLKRSLGEFPADKARLTVLHAAVGAITEADVHLAKASGALIIGFHVVAEDRARQLAEQLGVEIRLYRVIYEILDDLHKALAGLLEPVEREEARGSVEVRQVFNISRVGTIAGCYVTDGIVHRNHKLRLIRDGRIVLDEAAVASLKRFKDDVREVRAGLECGIKLRGFDDVKPGDVIQAYEMVEVAQEL